MHFFSFLGDKGVGEGRYKPLTSQTNALRQLAVPRHQVEGGEHRESFGKPNHLRCTSVFPALGVPATPTLVQQGPAFFFVRGMVKEHINPVSQVCANMTRLAHDTRSKRKEGGICGVKIPTRQNFR